MTDDIPEELKRKTEEAIETLRNHPDVVYSDGSAVGLEIWVGMTLDSGGSEALEDIAWRYDLDLATARVVNNDDNEQMLGLEYDILEQENTDLLNDDNDFELEYYLNRLRAAFEPNRFAILHTLYKADEGMSASELEDAIGKSGDELGRHLRKLEELGLIHNWRKTTPEQRDDSYYKISGVGRMFHDALGSVLERERKSTQHFRDE